MLQIYIVIVDLPTATFQLTTRALGKLSQAFRLSTSKTYLCMVREFLGFLVVAGISLQQVIPQVLLAFMQKINVQILTLQIV